MRIDDGLAVAELRGAVGRVCELGAKKAWAVERGWDKGKGTPVFTVEGLYATRGWTEWTQGFQYGMGILAFDATGDQKLLEVSRKNTLERMAPHVTHIGVHDHGFNNLSTYGNLRRLMLEGKIAANEWERNFYELAVKASGAVQASRWSGTGPVKSAETANSPGLGYVYSFNGPHSLFVDTMRTIRILSMGWKLGHVLQHENDRKADLLKRCVFHGLATNQYVVFHGKSGHTYDVRGRTSHEAVFNRNDGSFRAKATQQGYSPFSTWTRGLAWAILGYAEELEFFATISDAKFEESVGVKKGDVVKAFVQGAVDTADHYIEGCAARDGVVYWDDGAPGLAKMGDWRSRDAEPFNDYEPVDSSASAIAAQGLLRLGKYLGDAGKKYWQAGLAVSKTLMSDAYLATGDSHQGLLLHSVYHRPNGWDHVPKGRKVPCGESSMWGDYHLMELAVYLKRVIEGGKYLTFFGESSVARSQ